MRTIREAQTVSTQVALLTLYLFITVLIGGLLVFLIETAWDKVQVKEKMKGLSERFMWESKKMEQVTDIVQLNIMSMNERGYITELNEFMLKLIRRHYPDYTREKIFPGRLRCCSLTLWTSRPLRSCRLFFITSSAPTPRSPANNTPIRFIQPRFSRERATRTGWL